MGVEFNMKHIKVYRAPVAGANFYMQGLNGMRMELKRKQCQCKVYTLEMGNVKVFTEGKACSLSQKC